MSYIEYCFDCGAVMQEEDWCNWDWQVCNNCRPVVHNPNQLEMFPLPRFLSKRHKNQVAFWEEFYGDS